MAANELLERARHQSILSLLIDVLRLWRWLFDFGSITEGDEHVSHKSQGRNDRHAQSYGQDSVLARDLGRHIEEATCAVGE